MSLHLAAWQDGQAVLAYINHSAMQVDSKYLPRRGSLKGIRKIRDYAEAFFYVFDDALMLFSAIMWNVWPLMEFLPNDNKVYLNKDEKTKLLKPK